MTTPDTPAAKRPSLAEVTTAEVAATAAWQAARALPFAPERTIAAAWQHYASQRIAPDDTPGRLARANAVRRVMLAFGELHPLDLRVLLESERNGYTLELAVRAAEALASHPVLDKFQADFENAAERLHAAQQAQIAAESAAYQRGVPARLLERLRAAGVALAVNEGGNLTVNVGAALTPADRQQIGEHKAALVALLDAEAEAARPLVIA